MTWHVIQFLVNFFQTFIIYRMFDLFYERRFKFKYSVETVIVVATILLSLINYNYSISINMKLYLAYYLFLIILNIIIFKGNPFSKVFTFFLMVGTIGITELVSAALVLYVTKIDISLLANNKIGSYLVVFLSQILILSIYTIVNKRVDKEKMNLNNNIYYLMISLVLFFTVIIILIVIWMYGNLQNDHFNIKEMMVTLTMCVSFISVITIALTTKIINDIEEKHKIDLELQHIKLEQEYFTDVNSALEEIRILRHDMRGELAIIHGYNELNLRDKIRNHIDKKLLELDVKLIPKMDSDNMITSFLNVKLKEARANNINIDIQSNLTEESEINVDKEDICKILNNTINNAIEACKDCDVKYIKLKLDLIENCIIIKSENPFKGEINKTKHGYGLKSVKGIVEKYGGFVNINYDNNVFIIEAHVLMKSKYAVRE